MSQNLSALFDLPPSLDGPLPAYQVLARQYRPQRFGQVVGQETVVRVLTQALLQERLGHGFLFSGMRGIGKTTTARLLAKALNCLDLKKTDEGGVEPCGDCASCIAFGEEKHLDIMEMDAASHTGVDDIREILEACRYRPVLGRYKIFIIDEVHMLSKSAFNALLKTLEEPPSHVKFIFATTEVRKIPPTILSRCLRFDLRRLEPDVLIPYLQKICALENIEVEEEALLILARAGSGSARDSLSLLDQAMIMAKRGREEESDASGDGKPLIRHSDVRHMLGVLDREQITTLWKAILEGDAANSLHQAQALSIQGLEPLMILEELSQVVHQLSCLKAGAGSILKGLTEVEQAFLKTWESKVEGAVLGRLWQMLLKGVEEVRQAACPQQALEMFLIRLAYVTLLPTPDQLLRNMAKNDTNSALSPVSALSSSALPPVSSQSVVASLPISFTSFQAVVEAVQKCREGLLHVHLMQDVVVTEFEKGRIQLMVRPGAPSDLCKRLEHFLRRETGHLWQVRGHPSNETGKTLAQQQEDHKKALQQAAENHPLVGQVCHMFPGAVVKEVRRV